ncbi:MAG: helicase-exonuclease AddAB subunit AddA [Clostridia bacterium]|nr:helicase-exonuclease AddAB subunit AddA [Clostridia bacterium]
MKWTKEQREAIEYSGKNILLAAAAGSGKTAVLVQRIIELICREENPVNINELLVLTFTDAAAREMREKISAAIEKALAENPQNAHLQKQRLLIHSANISTIHSFCLQIIKNNIHITDLPVRFSLVSETENKMLLDEALSSVLERFYGKIEKDKSMADLVMGYGGIKNDSLLRETVLSLLSFCKSMPYPAKWLNAAVREFYKAGRDRTIQGTAWQNWLGQKTGQLFDEICGIYAEIQEETEKNLGDKHSYNAFFAEEKARAERIACSEQNYNYASVRASVLAFDFERLPQGMRNADPLTVAAQNKIKALRQLAKDSMADIWEMHKIPEEEMLDRIEKTYPVLRTLKNIVLICDRSYTKLKREKNFLDFSDLEHEALKLLAGKDGTPTETARALQKKYKEILIDEYQDTNHIQDTIFKVVSKQNSNIFMVGDLKQSIYTFRNAVPALFADKYQSYDNDLDEGHLIRLFKNFRSRKAVVDVANFIFSMVMSREIGDVEYTEDEYLIRGAEYPDGTDTDVFVPEFHFACSNGEVPEGEELLSGRELEARIAAKRIREMMDSGTLVFDKNKGIMRKIEYRDIVVLMRNTSVAAPIFEQTFEEFGIPVYTEVGRSYLDAREVQTVLSFLKIVDNPRQDIPLIAVMRSPIWGFSPEELAEMRASKRDGCFFDAVEYAAENGSKKAAGFLNELLKLRKKSQDTSVENIIWHIYYEYGYYAYSGAQSRGVERQANLRLLFERAAEFEHTGMRGLFGFMMYIENIRSQGDDLTPSKILGDGDDVVRIMTIHKSKGLEFPVVILSDTAHSFNTRDLSNNIIWNTNMGLAADFVDTKLRVRYPSLPRDIVAAQAKSELISEEMRLLYVALTRAREKLIVTSTFRSTKSGPALPLYQKSGQAKSAYVRRKLCFADWIMAAVLRHKDARNLREFFDFEDIITPVDTGFEIKTVVYKNQNEIDLQHQKEDVFANESREIEETFANEIGEKLMYEYERKYLGKIPVKLSVSEVKRMQAEEEDHTPQIDELKISSFRPLEKLSGAERGTIVHFVMQMADPKTINSPEDVDALLEKLQAEGTLTKTQADAVDAKKIADFFESDIGKRLKKAKRLEREFSFYTTASVSEVYNSAEQGEVLLQGTMDCFFEEEGGRVVLLDFKTDRAKSAEEAKDLSKKYSVQMKYYKKALAEILERRVDECWLCFLDCGEFVEV